MADCDNTAKEILATMQDWWWSRNPQSPWLGKMELSEAVNRLSMEADANPEAAILELLCSGDLVAEADFKWRKYRWGSEYQIEEIERAIDPKRWQTLASLKLQCRQQKGKGEPPEFLVDLEELGFTDTDIFDYEFRYNRFSTALCVGDHSTKDESYLEEWFSAWNIQIWPTFPDSHDDNFSETPDDDLAEPKVDKGGRPPAANWEAAVLVLSGRYYLGDFKPNSLADVKRALAEYLAAENVHPADSTIGNHAKPIFEAFQAWEQDAQKPG